ncbi:Protein kinase domain-containing protein [Mycena sanguinolenta]|uniref:non-specific serine/threonine protein kinase n=1 Tax=Mycena sanguinolenta TaxID=230812 RepID=A0A8H6Z4G0_9AGAR|nr:Protein kinase domain-containing protein [Mycena sanguinolenta]
MATNFLDLYEALDVIGNGAFGIIRKVRRKTDGVIFARKELNFERMNERDRKQIVAEVNILNGLHHDHIVRYHDRFVDRDAGILYILMEYCGGGDLSTVIRQAMKQNRPISEDAVWAYFMQILLALNHCHNTGGHGRTTSAGSSSEVDGKERRAQVLHRDLKPDNGMFVFLDENNTVKLGDFGLSKALSQTSFANTYVGTPYYMSPEVMQEKAYDAKSDIWSLGCLIYELCAWKPPFHDAKTLSELSSAVRSARIPPLPRGYSQALSAVIKSMLNLNPAMRPSAAQLLQHERIEFAFKVSETEKLLNTIKSHKASLGTKERGLLARESEMVEKESQITEMIQQRDAQIHLLQSQLHECQSQLHQAQLQIHGQPSIDEIQAAVKHREEELRVLVLRREEEVSRSMQRREDEIMEAVRRREAEVLEAWSKREEVLREEFRDVLNAELEARARMFEEREEEILRREAAVKEEEERFAAAKELLEEKIRNVEVKQAGKFSTAKVATGVMFCKGVKKDRSPLDEVQNILSRAAHQETPKVTTTQKSTTRSASPFPAIAQLSTPLPRTTNKLKELFQPSAMKGVVLTTTGEALATPSPAELAKMFDLSRRFEDEVGASPKVGLNFAQVFDFEDGDDGVGRACESPLKTESDVDDEDGASEAATTSSWRTSRTRNRDPDLEPSTSSGAPPTRLRRPSIRTSARRPTLPASVSDPIGLVAATPEGSQAKNRPKPLPHPHLASTSSSQPVPPPAARAQSTPVSRTQSAPEYDLNDEENLPSPFLKRAERAVAAAAATGTGSVKRPLTKRPSSGNFLRAVAAANASAGKRGTSTSRTSTSRPGSVS